MTKISIILSAGLFLGNACFAQNATTEVPKNWHQLDKDSTGYYGISLNKAYDFIKTKKTEEQAGGGGRY